MNPVLACIETDPQATGLTDCALWAAAQLGTAVQFLHICDRPSTTAPVHDLSSGLGSDSHDALSAELLQQEASGTSRAGSGLSAEWLSYVSKRAAASGPIPCLTLQREGSLVEVLLEVQAQARLIVLEQHPMPGGVPRLHFNFEVEKAVRSLQKPVLVVPTNFRAPSRVLIAYDGSATGRSLIETLAQSPFLRGLPGVLLTVGNRHDDIPEQHRWALETLTAAGFQIEARYQDGPIESVLLDQVERQQADLLIMGAYGHSRVREFIVGSTTTALLRTSPVPVLILR